MVSTRKKLAVSHLWVRVDSCWWYDPIDLTHWKELQFSSLAVKTWWNESGVFNTIMQEWMTNFIRYPTTTLYYVLEWSALWFAPICRPEYDSEERSQHWHLHNSLVVIVFDQIQCFPPQSAWAPLHCELVTSWSWKRITMRTTFHLNKVTKSDRIRLPKGKPVVFSCVILCKRITRSSLNTLFGPVISFLSFT